MQLHDWRRTMNAPHIYRVKKSTLHFRRNLTIVVALFFLATGFLYFYPTLKTNFLESDYKDHRQFSKCAYDYNNTYPITRPVKTEIAVSYKIAIVSDLDKDSKVTSAGGDTWISYFLTGTLRWMPTKNIVSVVWDKQHTELSTNLAEKGRAMELSELVTFDGKLLTFDDRTGVVYEIVGTDTRRWVILNDGNGKNSKGFKSEWATVKDNHLYVGSMGKEWTSSTGKFGNNNPMWVKIVSPTGSVQSVDWSEYYKSLRGALDITFPGYMIHETGVWSDIHQQWFFLPRRCSKDTYNEKSDEMMSTNVLLIADEYFANVKVTHIGEVIKIRGYSSFKFLPGSQDSIIVALKSEEYEGNTATYISAFTIDGVVLMPDVKVMDKKFEGIEFV